MRCISRWELLQQIASGMPTDAVLFAAGEAVGTVLRLDGRGRVIVRAIAPLAGLRQVTGAGLASNRGWLG